MLIFNDMNKIYDCDPNNLNEDPYGLNMSLVEDDDIALTKCI